MRCAPVAVWGTVHGLNECDVSEFARTDARLSHPNIACLDANSLVCSVLVSIMQSDGMEDTMTTSSRALEKVQEWLIQRETDHDDHRARDDNRVSSWVMESLTCKDAGEPTIQAKINAGHVKHAVMLLICMLRCFAASSTNDSNKNKSYTFEDALHDVLMEGGDTDTNACICGYVAGALCGFQGIPREMCDKVLQFDCTAVSPHPNQSLDYAIGYKRPSTYKASNVLALQKELVKVAFDNTKYQQDF